MTTAAAHRATPPTQARTPQVTIVMAVRNERATIGSALESALGQTGGSSVEVVVADGMSDDGTRQVLDQRAAVEPRLRVVDNPARSTPHGLNAALRVARGDYWVRLDGHSVLPPNYVDTLVTLIADGGCDAAGGVVRAVGRTPFGRAVACVQDSRLGIGNASHHYASQNRWVDHISHGAYRIDLSRAIGGFDESLVRNQDFDFDYRYLQGGGCILLHAGISFHRGVRETLPLFAQQQFEYGYWKCVVLRRHPRSLHVRWLVPPALVSTLVGSALMSSSTRGRRTLGACLSAYLTAVVGGAVHLGRGSGAAPTARIALALGTLHLSWGTGFMWSLLTRRGR